GLLAAHGLPARVPFGPKAHPLAVHARRVEALTLGASRLAAVELELTRGQRIFHGHVGEGEAAAGVTQDVRGLVLGARIGRDVCRLGGFELGAFRLERQGAGAWALKAGIRPTPTPTPCGATAAAVVATAATTGRQRRRENEHQHSTL